MFQSELQKFFRLSSAEKAEQRIYLNSSRR